MTGHLLGGAGGLEAGITVLAIRDQIAPPTINYEFPDPECDLDYVPNHARPMQIEYALSNSFGFRRHQWLPDLQAIQSSPANSISARTVARYDPVLKTLDWRPKSK